MWPWREKRTHYQDLYDSKLAGDKDVLATKKNWTARRPNSNVPKKFFRIWQSPTSAAYVVRRPSKRFCDREEHYARHAICVRTTQKTFLPWRKYRTLYVTANVVRNGNFQNQAKASLAKIKRRRYPDSVSGRQDRSEYLTCSIPKPKR